MGSCFKKQAVDKKTLNIKNFVVKYWQWIVMVITAIAFYLLGRSKDAKQQQVKLVTPMNIILVLRCLYFCFINSSYKKNYFSLGVL